MTRGIGGNATGTRARAVERRLSGMTAQSMQVDDRKRQNYLSGHAGKKKEKALHS